ncbi:hypothetical protein F5887DRAFT_952273 [Amanita rubescens]|nr:hypothetical protein F5887DRAFT_952273 [Amanita rubescens]
MNGMVRGRCHAPFDFVMVDLLGASLDYLADRLPTPVYHALIALASRSLGFLSSLLTLVDPNHWNAQEILPPLVTLLCTYLALLTIYRTTTWAFRTIFWFFKWGLILSVIFTGVGWSLQRSAGGLGPVDSFRAVFDVINSRIASGMQSTPMHSPDSKPRMWDSFESHRRWRETGQPDANIEVDFDRLIRSVFGPAAGFLQQGEQWLEVAKSIVDERQEVMGQQRESSRRKIKTRSR